MAWVNSHDVAAWVKNEHAGVDGQDQQLVAVYIKKSTPGSTATMWVRCRMVQGKARVQKYEPVLATSSGQRLYFPECSQVMEYARHNCCNNTALVFAGWAVDS